MESLASYLPKFIGNLTDSVTFESIHSDIITCLDFAEIQFPDEILPCLLVGYERGFQVWNIRQIQTPIPILSKRNTGVACLKYVPVGRECLLAYSPLYTTHESPKVLIYLYSGLQNEVLSELHASADVISIEVNEIVLVASLNSNEVEVYLTSDWSLAYKIECGCIGRYNVCLTASMSYLAWALSPRQVPAEDTNRLATAVSSTFYSIAEVGISAFKGYIDGHSSNTAIGSVSIRELESGTSFATIRAFSEPVSQLKLSASSSLLVVSPSAGHSFHVYSLGKSSRYSLVYTLHRGVTAAEICSIEVSLDEFWVVVTSSKGTFHVYKVHPEAAGLTYNVAAYSRIKVKSLLREKTYPKCNIRLVAGVSPEYRKGEVVFEPSPPELVCINRKGLLSKYVLHQKPIEMARANLLRPADFREKDYF